jgi:hypothetical protein
MTIVTYLLSMIAGAAIVGVALYKIVVTRANTNTDYLLCALGAGMIVFPVTGTIQLASAGEAARDQLKDLIQATQSHVAEAPPAVSAPPLPTPAPAPAPDRNLRSALEKATEAVKAYDQVRRPIVVRSIGKMSE